jgi:hypothetical protein
MKKTALCGYILLVIGFLGCLQLYTDVKEISLTAHFPPVVIARRAGGMPGARYSNWIVVPPAAASVYCSHFNLCAMGAYTVLVENNRTGYYRGPDTGQ